MANTSIELDSARAILSTYQQVNDSPYGNRLAQTAKKQKKNKEKLLEQELSVLKEQYRTLQSELFNKEVRLEQLNRQLIDRSTYATRLQEDFENAIYLLTNRKEEN